MKAKEWVICVKSDGGYLEVGKKYLITFVSDLGKHVLIMTGSGLTKWYKLEYFKTESQIRNDKLQNILND